MLPPQRWVGWVQGMLTVALSIARKLPCHVRLLGNTLAAGKMQHGSRTLDSLSRRFGVFLLPQVIWRLVAVCNFPLLHTHGLHTNGLPALNRPAFRHASLTWFLFDWSYSAHGSPFVIWVAREMHQRTRSMPAQHSCVIKRIQEDTKGFVAFSALMTSFADVRCGASPVHVMWTWCNGVKWLKRKCKTNNRNTGQVTNNEPVALAIAHLPLSLGGLGLTSATLQAQTAHWATIAAALPQQLENPTGNHLAG